MSEKTALVVSAHAADACNIAIRKRSAAESRDALWSELDDMIQVVEVEAAGSIARRLKPAFT